MYSNYCSIVVLGPYSSQHTPSASRHLSGCATTRCLCSASIMIPRVVGGVQGHHLGYLSVQALSKLNH